MTTAVQPRELREYQIEAVDAVIDSWANDIRRTGVVLPTGAGKSTVIAALALHCVNMGLRVVLLAHRGELLDQMALAIAAVDPSAQPVGIVRAEQDEPDAPIVAASLQTLANERRRLSLGHRDVILWDEVHHAGAAGWHETATAMRLYDGAFMCGFTATMRRDSGHSLGGIIESVAYEKDLRWAIEHGFLVPPRGLTVRVPELDLANVKIVAGDFHQGELAEVMEAAAEYVVDAITMHAADRQPIVFAASVEGAHIIADALSARGYPALAVDGSMGRDERDAIYTCYREGACRALVTVQILTEGADFPMCDCTVLARPTRSQVLYSQMVGRALRLHPGKTDALVLDLSGSTRVMQLITITDLSADVEHKTVDTDGNEIVDPLDQEAEYDEPLPKIVRQGPVDMVTIDLLSSVETNVLWLQTAKGVPFMSLPGAVLVFLWPLGDDTWAPAYMTDSGKGAWIISVDDWPEDARVSEQVETPTSSTPPVMDLDTARATAQKWVHEYSGKALPMRSASWRSNQAPSDKQLRFARMLGIPDTENMTKARLSDEISVSVASKRLDKAL